MKHGMTMNPSYKMAYDLGRARAELMGVGLAVSVRRVTEWHRRDRRYGTAWKDQEGEEMFLVGALARARHVFEVVSSEVVIARFDRRYQADAFFEAFCLRRVRTVTESVARLVAARRRRRLEALPDAA